MPTTPDRRPGENAEEGTVYDNLAAGNDPTVLGSVRMVDGNFRMQDQHGVFNPNILGLVVARINFML